MRFYPLIFVLLFSGCAQLSLLQDYFTKRPAQVRPDDAEVQVAEEALGAGEFEKARSLYREFQERRPQSVLFESTRIGEAQSLIGLGRNQEAVELLRDVYLKTQNQQPEIAAMALFRISFALENQGEDLKAIAALLDAKNRGSFLPQEISEVKIPARLAVLYAKLKQTKEVYAYLNAAEKGIAKVLAEKGKALPPSWLAQEYFELGVIGATPLTSDTFEEYIESQKVAQVYLFRALLQNDSTHSLKAQNKLQENYSGLLKQVEALAADRKISHQAGAAFVELMDQANLYRPNPELRVNSYQDGFFASLTEVRKKAEAILFAHNESTTLTEESKKLNGLKRPGRIVEKNTSELEVQSAKPIPVKVVPTEDPNL